MRRIFFIFFVLLLSGGILEGRGVKYNTVITNVVSIRYVDGVTNKIISAFLTTNVMAVYGVSGLQGITNKYTYAGGISDFVYSVTNNGNKEMRVFVILSNFEMTNSYAGSDWQGVLIDSSTSKTLSGTNINSITNRYNLSINEVLTFTVRVITANNSLPNDWGRVPVYVITSNEGGYITNYTGDNGIKYGGHFLLKKYPKVSIQAPFITLRKTMSVSNRAEYIARGGIPRIPVPGAVITYTNYYDNDGNMSATNLLIIDTIPEDTDFIIGSISFANYTGGVLTIRYFDRSGNLYTPTGANGTADPDIGRIIFSFESSPSISPDNGDTYGIVDGAIPDIDAGWLSYKVIVNRR